LYEDIFNRNRSKLVKILAQYLPDYPEKERLTDLIGIKLVDDLNKKLAIGAGPENQPSDDLIYEFGKYVHRISVSLYGFFRRDRAQDLPKFYRTILLVGAGFSVQSGVPLLRHLEALRDVLQVKSFQEIHDNKDLDQKFKKMFKEDILGREIVKTTKAHEIAAKMFHRKVIIEIISLNWDDLLEKAYSKYGEIPKINREDNNATDYDSDGFNHYLWKLHGDSEDPEYEWIYPEMKERVFSSFSSYMPKLMEHPHIFLVVGYSEIEDDVKKKIISLFEKAWSKYTFRIGLDLGLFDKYRQNYIVAPAEWLLPLFFEGIKES